MSSRGQFAVQSGNIGASDLKPKDPGWIVKMEAFIDEVHGDGELNNSS